MAWSNQQQRQQRAYLRSSHVHEPVTGSDLQRPQHAKGQIGPTSAKVKIVPSIINLHVSPAGHNPGFVTGVRRTEHPQGVLSPESAIDSLRHHVDPTIGKSTAGSVAAP